MHALAIIVARAGSRGVPGKNTAIVGGRPCLAWTIEAAREAQTVARIVVSTDGPLITQVAQEWGATVVKRPPDLATDTARVDDAVRHAVMQCAWTAGPVVVLYGNVPVRPPGLIDRCVRLLLDTRCDSVQSYSPVGKMHPWWMVRVDEAGQVQPWEGEVLNHGVYRRQDLPPAYVPDGGVLVVTREALFDGAPGPHGFLGTDRRGVLCAEGTVVDIDTAADLALADTKLRETCP